MRKILVLKNGRVLWKAFHARTFFQKAKGLMFSPKAFPLLLELDSQGTTRNSIHSFFCPVFDAVFLDERKRVVCIFKNIRPFKPFLSSPKPAKFLVELPPGESRKVELGDRLFWNPGESG